MERKSIEKKAPRIFRKELSDKKFNKRVLKRINIKEDKSFLLSVFQKKANGNYQLIDSLSTDQLKKLKSLAKSIKKNKGVVQRGKLFILLLIIGLLFIFNLFIRDKLLESVMEKSLQSVFQASVEIDHLNFALLKGQITFQHLQVADKDKPFKNLFELGRTEVSLDTLQLLKLKVIARNVECQEIRWNTERKVSGALEFAAKGTPDEEQGTGAAAAGKKKVVPTLPLIDISTLLDEQLNNLQSMGELAEVKSQLAELNQKWPQILKSSEEDLKKLIASVESISAIKINGLNSLKDIEKIKTDITRTEQALKSVKAEATAANRLLSSDVSSIGNRINRIQASIDSDLTYLESLIDLSSGNLKSILSSIAAGYLQENLGRYYGYGLKAMSYAASLSKTRKNREKKSTVKRGGQDIPFPTTQYPKFLLQNMALSIGSSQSARFLAASLQNLTSNPDLINKSLTFSFAQKEEKRQLLIDGEIDSRSNRRHDFSLIMAAVDYPLYVQEGLELLDITSLEGFYTFSTDFTLDRDGAGRGQGVLEVSRVNLDTPDSRNIIATAVYDAVTSAQLITFKLNYEISGEKQLHLNITSNIDELIMAEISRKQNELSAHYRDRLKAELSERVEAELAKNQTLYSALKELQQNSNGNLAEVQSYERVVAARKEEMEKRINELQSQIGKQLDKVKQSLPAIPSF
ncbi:MAG: TIGR03545 family protein [Spirochaeta sp.]|nr:TIGR03545 family protein [Spirochaeta sp.]